MSEEKSSYKQIMKATSLFGGVQVVNIFIGIVRSKFIAVLLGPEGMGIAGLLNTTTGFISGLTNFGLGTSAVKNVSAANGTGDKQRVSEVVAVLRRFVWFTGILGMMLTIVLSPWLSELTFGNRDYTLAFIWISVTLLLNQISSGQSVVLQGMRQLKYLAQSSVSGAFIGLLISVPIYYVWGIDGIVPAIILSSMAALLRTWYFARKVPIKKVMPTIQQTKTVGKEMLTMGFMLSLSGLLSLASSYFLRIFISNTGGVEQVGLFAAGFALINTYVGMIFKAMGTDYYPRLSAISTNNLLCKKEINQQAEIAILILAPIILFFFTFITGIIIILYSSKFLGITGMIYWAALGMFFKAASWPIGYIFLAKGDSKVFFLSEVFAISYMLIFNIIGYYYWGLTGIGASFALSYLIVFIQVFYISKIKYEFSIERSFWKLFIFQFIIACFGLLSVILIDKPFSYLMGIILFVISMAFSIKELNKRMDLKGIYMAFKNKLKKNR